VTAAAVERIHAALPQTQCTRCGYPDCHAYAQAIALEGVAINRCPPGGAEGIERLAQLTGRPAEHLDPDHGVEGPRTVAFIDENWCIGCTLCLDACPTDAIVGSHKVMHTVLEPWCTGCELCIPVCPVDCIELEPVTGAATGWAAWSAPQAAQALQRYEQRKRRLEREGTEHAQRLEAKALAKLQDLPGLTHNAQGPEVDRKRAVIEAALARARARRSAPE
jgi:electron transport complex protein RnfB